MMALLSSVCSMKKMASRSAQLKSLVNKLSFQERAGSFRFHSRTSLCISQISIVQSVFSNQRRKCEYISPYYLKANAGPWHTFLPQRTLSSESTLTQVDKQRGEIGSRRSRWLIEISKDQWFTADQWKQMKTRWSDEQQQRRKQYIARTEFEYELHAMESIAAQPFPVAAKSLIAFIKDEHTVMKSQLVSKCLFMCTTCQDLEGILWCVDWLEENQGMMDKGTIANAVSGLCLTDRWQQSSSFIARAADADCVTSRILEPYLIAACEHGDESLAKSLLEDHYRKDLIPTDASALKIIATFKSNADDRSILEDNEHIVTRLLDYKRAKRYFPSQHVAEELGNWFKSKQHETWKVSHTKISHTGVCKSCSSHLEPLQTSEEEFNNLREEIFSKVIRGKDIFRKTTPEELDAFMKFIDSGPSYDIVIDGLNVAKLKKRKSPGKVLRQFVEYLTKKLGYSCLVLGRHHMLKQRNQFEKGDMAVIQVLADCFFTQNMSEDDPFMMYATMHSGTKTKYVSRDLLRDHKALLSPGAHLSFIKWQRTQQLTPVDFREGKAIFKQNLAHDTVIQSTDKSWHIPYDDGQPRFSYEVPLTWLCAVKD
ncbi:mitochondrial ribonuclease P catalytic subunit [Strongylocentrotus purpuratus]|uniref:Mitochondrial ribonuclease P catalytic subunit n=1 Tax=Strongylocentrotus purpuratus TaxID=7668 RepID=A0A7M7HK93_STRPU|nr:mitochondrial ribonuclease P catalytic subunit [Strongylocentrotus purpuratus]